MMEEQLWRGDKQTTDGENKSLNCLSADSVHLISHELRSERENGRELRWSLIHGVSICADEMEAKDLWIVPSIIKLQAVVERLIVPSLSCICGPLWFQALSGFLPFPPGQWCFAAVIKSLISSKLIAFFPSVMNQPSLPACFLVLLQFSQKKKNGKLNNVTTSCICFLLAFTQIYYKHKDSLVELRWLVKSCFAKC